MDNTDGFVPDNAPASANDGFVPDSANPSNIQTLSGPTNTIQKPIDAFRTYLAKSKIGSQTSPTTAFQQDVSGPGVQDATVGDMANAYGVYKTPEAIGGLYNLGKAGISAVGGKIGAFLEALKASKGASELAGLETPMEAGSAIDAARTAEQIANKTTANALYSKLPKDISIPITTAQSTADTIVNDLKSLPNSFQSKKILAMVGDIQDMNKVPLATLQTMRSTLGEMAYNGEGVEKLYAARLSKALGQDIENFGTSNVLPNALSQGPSLEAQDLRKSWVDAARQTQQPGFEDVLNQGAYIHPANIRPLAPRLTNADIPANLKTANSFYGDMSNLNTSPLAQSLDRAALESKANVIFKSGRMDDINTAKALLGDQGFQAAQGQFYQKLLKSSDIGKSLTKYTPDFLQAALNPEQIRALQAVDLIHRYARNAKLIGGIAGAGTAIHLGERLSH